MSRVVRMSDIVPADKSKIISPDIPLKTQKVIVESEKHPIVETKKLNLSTKGGSTKKGAGKKATKKEANDWLVQMVREEEEKKLKTKDNPRSSTFITEDIVGK